METLVINALSYQLTTVTVKHFLPRFTVAANSSLEEVQVVNVRRDV